jgi:long-chain acyl-CoA synthetase
VAIEAIPPATPVNSTGALIEQAVSRFGDFVAMRQKDPDKGEWISYDWVDIGKMVRETAASLVADGVEHGDRVAIMSNSRLEWAIADLATLMIGAVVVPIYQSNLPDEVQYLAEHSGAVAIFVEDAEQLSKVKQIQGALPALRRVIAFTGKVRSDDDLVRALDRYREAGRDALEAEPELLRTRIDAVTPADVATIVYTSGTTGRPKGAVLTHEAVLFELDSLAEVLSVDTTDETLLFLPMAHIFARLGYLATLRQGFIISFADSIALVMQNMAEVKPTFVFSVPRIYEKVYSTITSRISKGMRLTKQMFAFATTVGRWISRRKQAGKWAWWRYPHLVLLGEMANMLMLRRLGKLFGGELRFFISGGAPLPREIAEFMHSINVLVLEGYGLTETMAASNLNTLTDFRFGTVGKPIPGVEIKIAEDGEILIKGPNVLREYYKRPEATAAAIVDGWFYSGDIGEFDSDGFLRITDRKKDLIVTSAGKNIAPQNLENHFKTDPWISQVVVFGDKRKYLVALITLDEAEVSKYADDKEIEYDSFRDLVRHERVRRRVDRIMADKNKKLASFETVKYWTILERDFEVGEELTPSMKVKRKVCTTKYAELLDAMYEPAGRA